MQNKNRRRSGKKANNKEKARRGFAKELQEASAKAKSETNLVQPLTYIKTENGSERDRNGSGDDEYLADTLSGSKPCKLWRLLIRLGAIVCR